MGPIPLCGKRPSLRHLLQPLSRAQEAHQHPPDCVAIGRGSRATGGRGQPRRTRGLIPRKTLPSLTRGVLKSWGAGVYLGGVLPWEGYIRGVPRGRGVYPGGPRGPRGVPPGAWGEGPGGPRKGPPGTPKKGVKIGPKLGVFHPQFGPPAARGPGRTPRGRGGVHFGGYLITLPVGTKWDRIPAIVPGSIIKNRSSRGDPPGGQLFRAPPGAPGRAPGRPRRTPRRTPKFDPPDTPQIDPPGPPNLTPENGPKSTLLSPYSPPDSNVRRTRRHWPSWGVHPRGVLRRGGATRGVR